uniref:Uncharacterized protein n=1 Tax=Dunaliella tertiolecta TaxID=3047 RepID=A0A7S3VI48_DUNTE|mmetsp:Transcript_4284/g.9945  ORF Transcript_4284/g.9945 Transcript_4284/m.9945 type:complete len:209 (-) Transcript_4284:36-662(-)|eukprot:1161273-Pelagomonas_calceolata.AAC.2
MLTALEVLTFCAEGVEALCPMPFRRRGSRGRSAHWQCSYMQGMPTAPHPKYLGREGDGSTKLGGPHLPAALAKRLRLLQAKASSEHVWFLLKEQEKGEATRKMSKRDVGLRFVMIMDSEERHSDNKRKVRPCSVGIPIKGEARHGGCMICPASSPSSLTHKSTANPVLLCVHFSLKANETRGAKAHPAGILLCVYFSKTFHYHLIEET